MNGRLKLIEQQLIGIDSAAFQNLCDIYLSLREQNIISINRTGSQLGKQKTVKGTPDTFFRLEDGSLRYVEYTTKADGLVEKIKEDIDKCLDESKTGIQASDVNKIIICFNSRITLVEETAITSHAASKHIRIELIGLDWLALEIYSKYLILAKDILGIPLDTGQLLPIQNFIDEYNNKGGNLSTPLDNIFLHRKTELTDIEGSLKAKDLLIISGAPGVGKTKIALEALNKFISSNNDYSTLVVSKKDQDISEDLRIHLQQDKNYILLIDDANRQLPNFKQILGVFREKRKGNIKLLITVRDYALDDILNECSDFSNHLNNLGKFSDEEITQLISCDSFEIKNPKYQKRIVEIADGNARLAVMASKLAKQEQVDFLYGDGQRIFELYDNYFKTFIKDFDLFANQALIKSLGVISFFFTIDRSDKKLRDILLKTFDIDYYEFNEAIDELEKRELVEIKYNNVRVSEQIMATYFFYKVFVKDEMLPFKTLLFSFFPDYKHRFYDTIIPANNSFGYENVLNKISGTLDEYLTSIYSDEEKVEKFFSMFWLYKREELLNYYHQRTKQLLEPVSPIYNTDYETNDFVWDKDKTLNFISNLFNHNTESFMPALELAFEHCRRKPEALPELIKCLRENLIFEEEDAMYGFSRQLDLFKLLIRKFKEGEIHYINSFFALAPKFLGHSFQITSGGRKNTISFYQYPLPLNSITMSFREQLWNVLFDSFDKYPNEVFSVINTFNSWRMHTSREILSFDLQLLLPFINNKLDKSNFQHVHYVQEFTYWLSQREIKDINYQNLKSDFLTEEYKCFRKLDWNSHRGKQDYEFTNSEEFQKLKEEDLRSSFIFTNTKDFEILHNTVKSLLQMKENNIWGISQSLNIIIEENFNHNQQIGFELLESFLNDYPPSINPFYKPINAIVTYSEEWASKLWNTIKKWDNDSQIAWKLVFFECLPASSANAFYKEEALQTIKSINRRYYIRIESFEKFNNFVSQNGSNDNFIETIVSIISDKNQDKTNIILSIYFFEKYSKMLSNNITLLEKSYLQQEKIDNHFDYERKGLKAILEFSHTFFYSFVKENYTSVSSKDLHDKLSFIWDIESCKNQMDDIMELMIESARFYGILEHPINVLFNNLEEQQKQTAKDFIFNYIKKNCSNVKKMNAIFDVLRHTLKEFHDEAFILYLTINTDIDVFKKIMWRGSGGVYSGNVIISDIHAKEWQSILSKTDKVTNQLDMIPIKTYIKKQIEYELRMAESERKRKFTDPTGF